MYSVSEAGILLGVHPTTIRRWDIGGKIKCFRTPGGHRRISSEEIQRIIAGKKRRYSKRKRGVVTYARVSWHDQKKKGDLTRQQDRLRQYCTANSLQIVAGLSDIASGLNTSRQGLRRLIKLVTKGKIDQVVINYPDRLTRFGFGYLEQFFSSYGVSIKVLEVKKQVSMEQEMVDDLVAIITSFSGRIHGMRGRKSKRSVKS